MKKVYRQPLAAFVEIAVCCVIAVFGGARGSGSSIGSGTVDSGVEWVVRREMIGRILGMAYRHLSSGVHNIITLFVLCKLLTKLVFA